MNKFDTFINSTLEEDWKTNLAAAGLAGAAVFGGTPITKADAQPSSIEQEVQSIDTEHVVNILARTIWAEGRGEKDLDMALRAIATSIYNRAQDKIKAGKVKNNKLAYAKVALTPYQYSAWNGWTIKHPTDYPKPENRSGRGWEESLKLAKELVSGKFTPLPEVGNSTHYFNLKLIKNLPSWAKNKRLIKIGNHSFVVDKMPFPSPRLKG